MPPAPKCIQKCIQTADLQQSHWPSLQGIVNCCTLMYRNIWRLLACFRFWHLWMAKHVVFCYLSHGTVFNILLLGKESQFGSVLFCSSTETKTVGYRHESSLSDYCLVQFKNYYSPCDFCNNHKLISQCIIQRVNFQVLKHTRFLLQSLIVPQHRYIPWADTKVKGRGCSAVAIAFHMASSSPPASGQDPFSGDTADRDTWTSWQMAVKIYLGFPL